MGVLSHSTQQLRNKTCIRYFQPPFFFGKVK